LREIADRILEQVRNVDPNYPDRVQIFEPTPRTNELVQHSSTSSWTSSYSTKLRERRYEAAPPTMQYCMSADIGRDPYDCDVPDAILICMDVQVAIETQRFGFEPVACFFTARTVVRTDAINLTSSFSLTALIVQYVLVTYEVLNDAPVF
uniref:PID domain-containing protein n=1 Tax=Angiostrongylus cantonensis TaxID=6313 RepID=A0A0K0D8G5_ANGCA